MDQFTTGQLAHQTGLNMETIRYYERKGLIPEPPRNHSGYRQYSEKDVNRVIFIKRTQALGFSLKEVLDILSLGVELDTSCGEIRKRVQIKLIDVEDKINDLGRIRTALIELSNICTGDGPVSNCPILDKLKF